MTTTLTVNGLHDLPQAAHQIIEYFDDYRIVALYGEMGAGKTTLISEIAAQMGVTDSVSSPTFSLVNQYNTDEGERIFHFDFYRINKIEEAFDFGYEEYFFSGELCLIEWPEKIEELLPEDTLVVRIEVDQDTHIRIIEIDTPDE